MNRGPKLDARHAAAIASDALAEQAPRCSECGSYLERGHLLGCSKLPAPVPVATCDECGRTPPYHVMTCSQGPLAGFREPKIADEAAAAAAVGDDRPATAGGRSAPNADDGSEPGPSADAQAASPAPSPPPDIDPETGELTAALRASATNHAARFAERLARLRAEAEERDAAAPPPLPDVELFPDGATVDITREHLALLAQVDVGWLITPRAPNNRYRDLVVTGYKDDPEEGRTFTVVRLGSTPWFQPIRAVDVEPLDILPPNGGTSRNAYRTLCAWVGKQTGTADELEPRCIANALTLSKTVI